MDTIQIRLDVKGMHCGSCRSLITMELDDAGLGENIFEVELIPGEEKGYVVLQGVSAEEVDKAKEVINQLGQYSVVN
jgi:copper chaperone CopZ